MPTHRLRRSSPGNRPGIGGQLDEFHASLTRRRCRSFWEKFWQRFSDWAGQAKAESAAWETVRNKGTRDGWLNRILQNEKEKDESPFRAVAMTQQLPRSLYGRASAIAMSRTARKTMRGPQGFAGETERPWRR